MTQDMLVHVPVGHTESCDSTPAVPLRGSMASALAVMGMRMIVMYCRADPAAGHSCTCP